MSYIYLLETSLSIKDSTVTCELHGWFKRGSKSRISVDELKGILRSARHRFIKKHGAVPNLLTVRVDEHQEWMDNMGIKVAKVSNNLPPRHFMLTFSKDSLDE